jgi:hypothetical protein
MSAPETPSLANHLSLSLVTDVLADDESTRLYALLQILSAAEIAARQVSLMLNGLQAKSDPLDAKRDLYSAIDLVDKIVARYMAASNEVFEAIRQRQDLPQTAPAVVIH